MRCDGIECDFRTPAPHDGWFASSAVSCHKFGGRENRGRKRPPTESDCFCPALNLACVCQYRSWFLWSPLPRPHVATSCGLTQGSRFEPHTAGEFEYTSSKNSSVGVDTLLTGAFSASAGLSVTSSTFTFLAASSTVTAEAFATDAVSNALKAGSVNDALQELMPTVSFQVSAAVVLRPPIAPPPEQPSPPQQPPNGWKPLPGAPPSIPPPVWNPFSNDNSWLLVAIVATVAVGGLAVLASAIICIRILRARRNPHVLPPKAQAAAASAPPADPHVLPPKAQAAPDATQRDVAVQMDPTTMVASTTGSAERSEGCDLLRPVSREAQLITTDVVSRVLLASDDESVETVAMPGASGFRQRVAAMDDHVQHKMESMSYASIDGTGHTSLLEHAPHHAPCEHSAASKNISSTVFNLPEIPDAVAPLSSVATKSTPAAAAAETELERTLKADAELRWAEYKVRRPVRTAPQWAANVPVAATRLVLPDTRGRASNPQVLPPTRSAPRPVRLPPQLAACAANESHTAENTASAELATWIRRVQP